MTIEPDGLTPLAMAIPFLVKMIAVIVLAGETSVRGGIAYPLGQDCTRAIREITEAVRGTFHILFRSILTENRCRWIFIKRGFLSGCCGTKYGRFLGQPQ